MVTAGGPNYGPPLVMDAAEVRQAISGHVVLGLEVARHAARKMRPGGPCCRVVTPGAVAALAVHNMSNTHSPARRTTAGCSSSGERLWPPAAPGDQATGHGVDGCESVP
jgi:hypothetical protein